jgi:hypothetical protein
MATTSRSVLAGLAAFVVVALAATGFWYFRDTGGQELDPAFQAELTTRVTPLVEEQMTTGWSVRMACAVRPVGADPASATTVAEVTAVYAWARCDSLTADGAATVTPVAVHLNPPTGVEAPTDADWSNGTVGEMFPERLHEELLEGRTAETNAELETALRERIRELS